MVLREPNDPLNQSRGIMGPLENATGVQNNRGRLRQRFDLIRKLGQGTYGKVQLGIDKETGQEVAIKTIKKSKIETEADLIRIRREIQIMSSVRHPNIIHIYEVFENREKMVLVMEYAAGGELYDYLNERKILQEDEARRIFRQIASAVYYCHKHKICHRDLKLENILLDEKFNAKIADFGLSNVFDEVNLLKTFCGSPLYASPEIVRGTPYKGPDVDCWSLGVLLYTLVYGAMPFDGSNFKRLVKQISHGDYFEPKKPAEASPLIRIMLTVDPKKRADIRKVCSHPWVNQGFDRECLLMADELATQTPVRLDLLLALANCSAINHSQVVIEQPPQAQQSSQMPEGAAGIPDVPQPSASTPVTNDAVMTNHVGEREAPKKPKRSKVQSKSKSSPMLELIRDEEEQLELPQPDDKQGANEEDDACDTLSEISEIQTLAEDIAGESGALAKAATSEPVRSKDSKVVKKDKVAKVSKDKEPPKPSAAPPVTVPAVKPQLAAPSPIAATTPVEAKPRKTAEVPPPVTEEKPPKAAPPPNQAAGPAPVSEPPQEVAPTAPPKKKIVRTKTPPTDAEKPKSEVAVSTVASAAPAETPAPAPTPVPTPAPTAVQNIKDKEVPSPVAASPRETTPAPKEKSATPTDKEGSGDSGEEGRTKAAKLKDRADSVSPTRIERRNSKVISQKTAELIQNLETKVLPSATINMEPPPKPPGIKKIVIPTFKMSDAKSKFESKPPRPLTTSVSRSKAAFEAKLQSQSSVEEKQPPKPPKGESPPASEPSKPKPPKGESPPASEPSKPKPPATSAAAPPTAEASSAKAKEEPPKVETSPAPITPAEKPAQAAEKPEVDNKATEGKSIPSVAAKVAPPRGPGKIQIPASLATASPAPVEKPAGSAPPVTTPAQSSAAAPGPSVNEVKPVLMDSGKGGPKAAVMITKGKPSTQSDNNRIVSTQPSATPATTTTPQAEPLSKTSPNEPQMNATASSSDPPHLPTSAPACSETTTCVPHESDTEGETTGKSGATAPPPLGPAAAAKQKLLSKLPPAVQQSPAAAPAPAPAQTTPTQNGNHKEQAAKKISSVITKIVNSGSVDKGLNLEDGPRKFSTLPRAMKPEGEKIVKTEVSFPVCAATQPLQSQATPATPTSTPLQERIIPIKLVDDVPPSTPPQSSSATSVAPSASQSTTSMASRGSIPISRADSSYRSMLSRQNSSDTETCSVATQPPKPEPIRKCPREFLIPIKMEESGQTVTPKEELTSGGSTQDISQAAGEDDFRIDSRLRSGRFARPKRYSSILSDSSFDEEPSVSVAGSTGAGARRASTATTTGNAAPASGHSRSRSQGDEPTTPGGTFKRYRNRRHATAAPDMPLDRSDSFSSAEEDEEDAFQVLTAESLFSNLLDRVRNLTRRINRDDPLMTGPNWSTDPTTFGLWGASPLREFMSNRAPSETRSFTGSTAGSYRREPSVSMSNAGGPGGAWRRSLSRDLSGDSDSGHSASMNATNAQSRRLTSDLYETGSARSLPLSSRRSPSYLSHRSVDTDLGVAGTSSSYGTTPRSYSRTLGHSGGDYGGGGTSASISRTLPLRRSLKTFDRAPQNILPEYETTPAGMSSRHSLFDSKYDTTPSYLSRLRSASRDRLGSERPSERDQGSRLRSSTLYPPSGEANGWDGGHDAVSTSSSIAASYSTAGGGQSSISPMSTAVSLDSESLLSPNSSFSYHADGIGGGSGGHSPSSSSSRLLSVQEKMNNYSQYYQSLTQSPFRRLPMASPSQIHANSASFGVGLSELRNSQLPPVNLSRPGSFVPEHNNSISSPLKVEAPEVLTSSTSTSDDGSATPCVQSPVSNPLSSVTSPSISPPQIPSPPMPTTNKSELSPKNAEEIRAAANSSKPPTAASSGIPRWPTVSVRQHRPLSISSFPDGPRASSVSRVMSPPPPPEKSSGTATVVNGTGDSSSHSSVAALVQKRRDARATSVERITRLLERKSMPREVVPTSSSGGGECTKKKPEEKESSDLSASTTELNGNDSKGQGQGQTSKKPKFLQNLEKKWEKLTHSGGSKTTDQEEAIVNGAPELAPTAQAATTTKVGGGAVVSSPASPEPQQPQTRGTSEESSSQEDKNDKINESVLIRRALSPEKKVKSTSRLASAGGTVNFMLGKFKKMEQEPQVGAPAASKIPMGRPPMCSAAPTMGSRLGLGARRIQQPYSGATSDSVLTLTAAAKEMSRTADTSSNGEENGLIKSAAMVAQEKRRLQPRIEVKKDGPSNQEGPTTVDSDNKPFTASNSSPSPTTPVAPAPPPQIQIQDEGDSKGVSSAAMPSMDMSSLSPISVVDGDRTDNSEEGGPPPTKSESGSVVADDDTESVSDRILRKSFYNRFNAGGIDRNRRSHSVTPASTRRSIGSSNTANLRVNGSGGGGGTGGSKGGPSAGSSSGQQQPSARRSVSPSASTVASFESKESGSSEQSSTQQNRSPSPYWSGLNKYNPNPLFKELMVNEDFRTANDVGKKAEYSRRITSKLSKLLREIESDLNSCHLTKTGSGASEDGDSAGLLLGQPSGTNSHSGGHHHHHHHHHHHQHKSGHGHGHMHSNKGTSASPMTTPFANN